MKPVIVTVGPLATADADGYGASQAIAGAYSVTLNGALSSGFTANNICASQSPGSAGDLTIDGTTAASGVAYLGNGASVTVTSAGNDSGITFTVYGQALNEVGGRNQLAGNPSYTSETVAGANVGVSSTRNKFLTVTRIAVSAASAAAVTVGTNGTVTADKPRQVIFTSGGNDTGITFTIYGTDWNDDYLSQAVTGASGGVATSSMNFKTISQIVTSGAVATTLTVGTNGVAASRPIFLDQYGFAPTSLQVTVSGTCNFTVMQSMDNPNDIGYANVTWVNHPDSALAAATATAQGNYAYIPNITRIVLNSGTGTVVYTVLQAASPT